MKKAILNTAMLAIALMATATASAQRDMQLTVSNIPNDKGQILVATKSGQWAKVKAEKGKIETIIKDVPDGKGTIYAFMTRTATDNSTRRTIYLWNTAPSETMN